LPDPYGQQIGGMGGATWSTSKIVIVGPSSRDDCDVDYRFGQVAIDKPVVDWSGNCGNPVLATRVDCVSVAGKHQQRTFHPFFATPTWHCFSSSRLI
jgi:2-methylaconitate cis-trans-isomerase PrpF